MAPGLSARRLINDELPLDWHYYNVLSAAEDGQSLYYYGELSVIDSHEYTREHCVRGLCKVIHIV